MRKTILIVTCYTDEIDETMATHLEDVLEDGCPVELIINGRHIPIIMRSAIVDHGI